MDELWILDKTETKTKTSIININKRREKVLSFSYIASSLLATCLHDLSSKRRKRKIFSTENFSSYFSIFSTQSNLLSMLLLYFCLFTYFLYHRVLFNYITLSAYYWGIFVSFINAKIKMWTCFEMEGHVCYES